MDKIAIGKLGETHAAKFLIANNYCIIHTNFHCRFGEIDIIAVDMGIGSTIIPRHRSIPHTTIHPQINQSGPQLVFIEVKTRTSELFGLPEESISHQKLNRIFKTAIHFLNSSTKNFSRIWRIDAIAVKLTKNLLLEDIKHFKNISHGS